MALAEAAKQASNLDDATFQEVQSKFEMMIQSSCANTGRPLCSTDVLATVLAIYSSVILELHHKVAALEERLASHEHAPE